MLWLTGRTGRRALGTLILGTILSICASSNAAPPSNLQARHEIVEQLKAEKFAALEVRFAHLLDSFADGTASEQQLINAFAAFENSDTLLEGKLFEWVRRDPQSPTARIARGKYYSKLGWLSRGALRYKETAPVRLAAMRQYFKRATADLENAIRLRPGLFVAYAQLIQNIRTFGGAQQLDALYERAVEANPGVDEVHVAYLDSVSWFVDVDARMKIVERARRKHKLRDGSAPLEGYTEAYLAFVFTSSRDFEAAIEQYGRAIEKSPRARFFAWRAGALVRLEDYDRAAADLARSVEINPTSDLFREMARVRAKQARFADSMSAWNQAVVLDPSNPMLRLYRSGALIHAGKLKEARRDLEHALLFGSHDPNVHSAIGNFHYKVRRDPAKALKYLRRTTELVPESMKVLETYADALYDLDDCRFPPAAMRQVAICIRNGACGPALVERMVPIFNRFESKNRCSVRKPK